MKMYIYCGMVSSLYVDDDDDDVRNERKCFLNWGSFFFLFIKLYQWHVWFDFWFSYILIWLDLFQIKLMAGNLILKMTFNFLFHFNNCHLSVLMGRFSIFISKKSIWHRSKHFKISVGSKYHLLELLIMNCQALQNNRRNGSSSILERTNKLIFNKSFPFLFPLFFNSHALFPLFLSLLLFFVYVSVPYCFICLKVHHFQFSCYLSSYSRSIKLLVHKDFC